MSGHFLAAALPLLSLEVLPPSCMIVGLGHHIIILTFPQKNICGLVFTFVGKGGKR